MTNDPIEDMRLVSMKLKDELKHLQSERMEDTEYFESLSGIIETLDNIIAWFERECESMEVGE